MPLCLEELYFEDEEPGVQTLESPDPGRIHSVFATQKTMLIVQLNHVKNTALSEAVAKTSSGKELA